jgi:hypothetical protein
MTKLVNKGMCENTYLSLSFARCASARPFAPDRVRQDGVHDRRAFGHRSRNHVPQAEYQGIRKHPTRVF